MLERTVMEMADSVGEKKQRREFALASVAELYSDDASASPAIARFSCDGSAARLRIHCESQKVFLVVDFRAAQLFKLGPVQSVCMVELSDVGKEYSVVKSWLAVAVQFKNEEESEAFHCVFRQWKKEVDVQGPNVPNGTASTSKSKFDEKTESSSAKLYFRYYGHLQQQQNMLQDYVRTGTYFAVCFQNRADFNGRVVVDVGAGSGILSLFAAQAGAKHVYAVEASEMAEYAQKLIAANPILGERITLIKGKVEDVELPEKADILISEPMGTLLVNERMLESYVIARDRFLIPNGKMFPALGRIHMAPFTDEYLFGEIANKAFFWQQINYFGVDLRPLYGPALEGCFSQPVVDAFDPRLLIAPPMFHEIDFTKIKEEELYEIDIPLRFIASVSARVHGLGCWFDVLFNGSSVPRWLTTSPGSPTTHWYQLRCVLSQPIYVLPGQEITGRMHMIAHNAQSYTIHLTLSTKTWGPGAEQGGTLETSSSKYDLKDCYYRVSVPFYQNQEQQPSVLDTQDLHIQSLDLSETENNATCPPNSATNTSWLRGHPDGSSQEVEAAWVRVRIACCHIDGLRELVMDLNSGKSLRSLACSFIGDLRPGVSRILILIPFVVPVNSFTEVVAERLPISATNLHRTFKTMGSSREKFIRWTSLKNFTLMPCIFSKFSFSLLLTLCLNPALTSKFGKELKLAGSFTEITLDSSAEMVVILLHSTLSLLVTYTNGSFISPLSKFIFPCEFPSELRRTERAEISSMNCSGPAEIKPSAFPSVAEPAVFDS
ncbi:putative histone-arginine methyltransferase 1.4 isoform X1 [Senna tora]|uniref:type I protein arginine methyltransferase n=1 Tax=Senna tora TaxID=362788 RepID=A0A834WXC5_9FABA|nr:putative histone-arginine methyltransferase 1.4 isoform X1 [Senna tora]